MIAGATRRLTRDRKHIHNRWNRELPPALTVDSGDTVVFETRNASDDQPIQAYCLCSAVVSKGILSGAPHFAMVATGAPAVKSGTGGYRGSWLQDSREG